MMTSSRIFLGEFTHFSVLYEHEIYTSIGRTAVFPECGAGRIAAAIFADDGK